MAQQAMLGAYLGWAFIYCMHLFLFIQAHLLTLPKSNKMHVSEYGSSLKTRLERICLTRCRLMVKSQTAVYMQCSIRFTGILLLKLKY